MEKTIVKSLLFNQLGTNRGSYTMRTRSGKGYSPEQQVVTFTNGSAFYSYNTLIGVSCNGKLYLTDYHDYSRTTSAYCGMWCGLGLDNRRKGLQKGEITAII